MRKRRVQIGLACAVILAGGAFLSRALEAQPLSRGIFYLAVRPLQSGQNTLRVNTSTTPQRTEIGCEAFVESGTTVNCLRLTGSVTGASPVIGAISGTSGDASVGLLLLPQGAGVVQISGTTQISGSTLLGGTGVQFTAAKTGFCLVSAPSAVTPFTTAVAQTTCSAPSIAVGDRIFAMGGSDADAFLMLKTMTPVAGGGAIQFGFTCVSSSTCPTITVPHVIGWWAITP